MVTKKTNKRFTKMEFGRYGLVAKMNDSEMLRQLIPMQFDFIEYDCMSRAQQEGFIVILFIAHGITPAKIKEVNSYVNFFYSMQQIKVCHTA